MPKLEEGGAKIKIEKALSTRKGRNKSLRLFHTPATAFAKNTKRTRTVEMHGCPRPPDIQICVFASDGIERARNINLND